MKLLSITAILAVGLLAMPASAVVLSDDFNSYSDGQDLIDDTDWIQFGTYHTGEHLQDFVAGAEESPFSAVAEGLSGRYYDTNTSSQGASDGVAAPVGALDTSATVTVSFDFMLSEITATNVELTAMTLEPVFGASNGSSTGSFLYLFHENNGSHYLANRNPNNTYTDYTDAPVVVGDWYHIEVTFAPIDDASDTYSFTYTDELGNSVSHADIPYRVSLDTAIQQFNVWHNGAASGIGNIHIDNFAVGVPEPASLALLASGLALVACRRRRS